MAELFLQEGIFTRLPSRTDVPRRGGNPTLPLTRPFRFTLSYPSEERQDSDDETEMRFPGEREAPFIARID